VELEVMVGAATIVSENCCGCDTVPLLSLAET